MSIESGARLGPYEILSPIGAGGMGEVYRARDTRLDRVVAVKVLSNTTEQFRARFQREAKAISSLTHPNICTLHDVGSQDGVDYLVMEHLEGETLADRLAHGPVPFDQAIRYAIEIADALGKAHRRGITHRDLKPGNIMITRGGTKLLDFGLAKQNEGAADSGITLLTERKPITEEGTILGTFQYMAPEQLEGAPADARTDIFAFGVVLYEMVTGRRAFDGKTRSSVAAAILATEPAPISTVQPLTPPPLERIIQICLRKDPDERWQSIHDVRLELENLAAGVETAPPPPSPRKLAWAGWVAAAIVAIGALAWFLIDRRTNHVPPQRARFEISPPENRRFNVVDAPALLSPDGSRFLLRLTGLEREQLLMRAIDSTELVPLRGSEGGFDPFWAPDGRQFGFFASGKMKRFDLATSAVSTITSAAESRGATWGRDGTILFSPSPSGPIHRIDVKGGASQPVTTLDKARKEIGHWRPSFLPDGNHFLFMSLSENADDAGVFLASLESKEVTRVLPMPTPAVYVEPGYLVYLNDFDLYAQKLDLRSRSVVGDGMLIARNAEFNGQFASAGFSAAQNGTILFHRRGPTAMTTLTRMSIEGTTESPVPTDGVNVDLSRDGTRIAMQRVPTQQRNTDIWTFDLRRNMPTRITFEGAEEIGPVWSPDDRTLIYAVNTATGISVRTRSSSGAGAEQMFLPETGEGGIEIVDWSRDGRFLMIEAYNAESRLDLMLMDITTRKMTPIANTPFSETSGRFSPDGKWLAYSSDEAGTNEIFLQPFPPNGNRWQISSGGGNSPRWTGDSKRLFFVGRDMTLMHVEVAEGNITPAKAHRVIGSFDYVLLPEGREVIVSQRDSATAHSLEVLMNWLP